MENEDERSVEDTQKETVFSEFSSCFSATDTQDEKAVMALTKTGEEVIVRPDSTRDASAKPEKTGRAKRREKRLKNEPQNVLSEEGPSGVHVLDFAEARATELNHLVKAMRSKGGSKRAFQGLPRHMRRRAMSHNVKRLPRRLRKKAKIEMEKSSGLHVQDATPKKKGSRKQRRKPTNLKKEYQRRQRTYAWLETHIWHAKRMKMVNKSYGFRLAEHCSDKGVRAAYRSLIHGCMLSDISYYCCTEVTGEQNHIIDCLSSLFNSNTGLTIGAKAYLSGQREGKAIMYKAYPYGAIGPVQFLWQAPPPQKPVVSVLDALTQHSPATSQPAKLWLWSHPAMHEQVLSEVQARIAPHSVSSLSAKSLKMDLVRFRLIGPRSHALLMETLKPVFDFSSPVEEEEPPPTDAVVPLPSLPCVQAWWDNESDQSSVHSDILSSIYSSIKSVSNPAQFCKGSVLGMTVYDPRLTTPTKRTDMVSAYYPNPKRGPAILQHLLNGDSNSDATDDEDSDEDDENEELSSDEDMEILPRGVAERHSLPTAEGSSTSETTSILSMLPVGVAYSPIWDSGVRKTVTDDKIGEHVLKSFQSQQLVRTSIRDLQGKANRIPILLIQQSMQLQSASNGHGSGWDLILPANWGLEFWVSLIYHGARACGMKELRKCSLEIQAPHFPHDYPDTAAGRQYSLEQKEALETRYHSLPPDKRRNYGKLLISSPFFSPWIELISKWKTNIPPKLCQILSSHFEAMDEDDSDLLQPSKKLKLDIEDGALLDQGLQTVLKPLPVVNQEALNNSPSFYVLRCRDALRTLSQFIEYIFKHKKQQKMLTSVAGSSSSSEDYSDKFLQSCMSEFQIFELLREHASALLAVKFETNQRGTVCDRATISVPCDSDLRCLVTMVRKRPFSGPKEEINQKGMTLFNGNSVCVGISSLTRKQIKEVKQIHKLREKAKRAPTEASAAVAVSPMEEFKLCPVMPSRQEFGYVTTAGLRLTTSHSSGIGFCTFVGLLETVRRCYAAQDIYELLALARGEDIQYWIIKLQLNL